MNRAVAHRAAGPLLACIGWILCVALASALTGCGGGDPEDDGAPTQGAPAPHCAASTGVCK